MAPRQDSVLSRAAKTLEEAETSSDCDKGLSELKAAVASLHTTAEADSISSTSLKKLSARWAPSLISVLKAASAQLSREAVDSTSAQSLANALEEGIKALELFRGCLNGRPIELELHRHAIVCKLIAHQHYGLAKQQACKILSVFSRQPSGSLQCNTHASSTAASISFSLTELPKDIEHDTAHLVVATSINIILCSVSSQDGGSTDELAPLVALLEQVQPWLRYHSQKSQLSSWSPGCSYPQKQQNAACFAWPYGCHEGCNYWCIDLVVMRRLLPEADARKQHGLLSKYLCKVGSAPGGMCICHVAFLLSIYIRLCPSRLASSVAGMLTVWYTSSVPRSLGTVQAAVLARGPGHSIDNTEAEALALSLGRWALRAAAAAHVAQRAAQAYLSTPFHAVLITF